MSSLQLGAVRLPAAAAQRLTLTARGPARASPPTTARRVTAERAVDRPGLAAAYDVYMRALQELRRAIFHRLSPPRVKYKIAYLIR